ncbi:MAG: thiamine pyrophosphate-binding protein, partial [Actinomycetales bacterium]
MSALMGSGRIVGDDLAEALYEAGVRIAFGLDDPRGYWVGLRRSKIRPVIVHDERSGGFMAEAFTRAGGGLATCSGISGPGAANLVPGLHEAHLSSVPVLAVLGEKRPAPFGGREFQGVDHRTLLAGVVKATVEVDTPEDIRSGAIQAVRLATSGRPRPVLLLTRDLLQQRSISGPTPMHVPDTRSAGDYVVAARPGGAHADDIARGANALIAAREPAIVIGGGAAISGAGAVAAELAERIGAPIIATPMGKGVVAEDHPLACGIITAYSCGVDGYGVTALEILKRTDCVLIVGSDL